MSTTTIISLPDQKTARLAEDKRSHSQKHDQQNQKNFHHGWSVPRLINVAQSKTAPRHCRGNDGGGYEITTTVPSGSRSSTGA